MEEIKEIDPRVEKIVELRNGRIARADELKSIKKEYDKICNYKNNESIDVIRIVPESYGKETERLELFFGDCSRPLCKNILKNIIQASKETLEKDMKRLEDEIHQIDNSLKEMLSDEFKLPPVTNQPYTGKLHSVQHDPYGKVYGSWPEL